MDAEGGGESELGWPRHEGGVVDAGMGRGGDQGFEKSKSLSVEAFFEVIGDLGVQFEGESSRRTVGFDGLGSRGAR